MESNISPSSAEHSRSVTCFINSFDKSLCCPRYTSQGRLVAIKNGGIGMKR